MPAAEAPPMEEPQFSIPNLGNLVVISQSIALFQIQPNLKLVVPVAVDRAIREILSAVVDRSVTI